MGKGARKTRKGGDKRRGGQSVERGPKSVSQPPAPGATPAPAPGATPPPAEPSSRPSHSQKTGGRDQSRDRSQSRSHGSQPPHGERSQPPAGELLPEGRMLGNRELKPDRKRPGAFMTFTDDGRPIEIAWPLQISDEEASKPQTIEIIGVDTSGRAPVYGAVLLGTRDEWERHKAQRSAMRGGEAVSGSQTPAGGRPSQEAAPAPEKLAIGRILDERPIEPDHKRAGQFMAWTDDQPRRPIEIVWPPDMSQDEARQSQPLEIVAVKGSDRSPRYEAIIVGTRDEWEAAEAERKKPLEVGQVLPAVKVEPSRKPGASGFLRAPDGNPIFVVFPELSADDLKQPQNIEIVEVISGGKDGTQIEYRAVVEGMAGELERRSEFARKPLAYEKNSSQVLQLTPRPGGKKGEPAVYTGTAPDGRTVIVTSALGWEPAVRADGKITATVIITQAVEGGFEYKGRIEWERDFLGQVDQVRATLLSYRDILGPVSERYPAGHEQAGEFVRELPQDLRTAFRDALRELNAELARLAKQTDAAQATARLAELGPRIQAFSQAAEALRPHLPELNEGVQPFTEAITNFESYRLDVLRDAFDRANAVTEMMVKVGELDHDIAATRQEIETLRADTSMDQAERDEKLRVLTDREATLVTDRADYAARLKEVEQAIADADAAMDLLEQAQSIAQTAPDLGADARVGGEAFRQLQQRLAGLPEAVRIKTDPRFAVRQEVHSFGENLYVDLRPGDRVTDIRIEGDRILFDTNRSIADRQAERGKREDYSYRCSVDDFVALVEGKALALDAASVRDEKFLEQLGRVGFRDLVRYLNREETTTFRPLYSEAALWETDQQLHERMLRQSLDRLITDYIGVKAADAAKLQIMAGRQDYHEPTYKIIVAAGETRQEFDLLGDPAVDNLKVLARQIRALIATEDRRVAAAAQAAADAEAARTATEAAAERARLDAERNVQLQILPEMRGQVLDVTALATDFSLADPTTLADRFAIRQPRAGAYELAIGELAVPITQDQFVQLQRDGAMRVTELPTPQDLVVNAITHASLADTIKYLNGEPPAGFAPLTVAEMQRKPADFERLRQLVLREFVNDYLGLTPAEAAAVDVQFSRLQDFENKDTFTFHIAVGEEFAGDLEITGDPARDELDALRSQIRGALAERRERLMQQFGARVGMRGAVLDLDKLVNTLHVPLTELPGATFDVVSVKPDQVQLRIGAQEFVCTPDQFFTLHTDGAISIKETPLRIPEKRSTGELKRFSREKKIDPPVLSGETLLYRGPTIAGGVLTDGTRIVITGVFGEKQNQAVGFFLADSVNRRTGEAGEERALLFADFQRLLESGGEQSLTRVGPAGATGEWMADRLERGQPVDGLQLLKTLDLVSYDLPGEDLGRCKIVGAVAGSDTSGAVFGRGASLRIRRVDDKNQWVIVAPEDLTGGVSDGAREFAIPYSQLLANHEHLVRMEGNEQREPALWGKSRLWKELDKLGIENPEENLVHKGRFYYKLPPEQKAAIEKELTARSLPEEQRRRYRLGQLTEAEKRGLREKTTSPTRRLGVDAITDYEVQLYYPGLDKNLSLRLSHDEFLEMIRGGRIVTTALRPPEATPSGGAATGAPPVVSTEPVSSPAPETSAPTGPATPGTPADPAEHTGSLTAEVQWEPEPETAIPQVRGLDQLRRYTPDRFAEIKRQAQAKLGFVNRWVLGDRVNKGIDAVVALLPRLEHATDRLTRTRRVFMAVRPRLGDVLDANFARLITHEHELAQRLDAAFRGLASNVPTNRPQLEGRIREITDMVTEAEELATSLDLVADEAEAEVATMSATNPPEPDDLVTEESARPVASEPPDVLLPDARNVILSERKATASFLQRRLRIGYNRAAKMIQALEAEGFLGPSDGLQPREILGRREAQPPALPDDLYERDEFFADLAGVFGVSAAAVEPLVENGRFRVWTGDPVQRVKIALDQIRFEEMIGGSWHNRVYSLKEFVEEVRAGNYRLEARDTGKGPVPGSFTESWANGLEGTASDAMDALEAAGIRRDALNGPLLHLSGAEEMARPHDWDTIDLLDAAGNVLENLTNEEFLRAVVDKQYIPKPPAP